MESGKTTEAVTRITAKEGGEGEKSETRKQDTIEIHVRTES